MEVRLDDIIVSKSGNSSGGENCNLYGQNAALLVKDGAIATISDAQITSTAKGASGVFCYGGSPVGKGDGTRLDISDSTVTTSGDNSGGVATTGGGETHVKELTVNTSGKSSSPIRSDQGGGTVTVDSGTYISTGVDSPAVYSMADISIKDSSLIAHYSPGVVIKGRNSAVFENCLVSSDNSANFATCYHKCSVLIYDPDNQTGIAKFSAVGGTITSIEGHVIHVTNTAAKILLDGVIVNNSDPSNTLLSVSNDKWSGIENNAEVEMRNMEISGNIIVSNEATSESNGQSNLDLVLASSTIYTGAINQDITPDNQGTVNLTVRQGSKFILSGTSYVSSLVNNGRIICGDYDLYVNGEKYDDGGSRQPTESELILDGTNYVVKDNYGKISVEQGDKTKEIVATIKKSGNFIIKGSGVNTSIRISKKVKDVFITLSNLSIDNTNYASLTGEDDSIIIFEPEASGAITLEGESRLIGASSYNDLPKALIRGNESNIVFDGSGTLILIDSMPESTIFDQVYPHCIYNYAGLTSFNEGTFRCRSNGCAIYALQGTVNIAGATINVEYTGEDAVNADDGIFNMESGRLDVSECNGKGISASVLDNSSKGTVIISGGEIRLYKIADSGIRGENIFITGGEIDITNIYEDSGYEIYAPGNEVPNKITVCPMFSDLERTRVNYNAGSHHGIEAGRRAMKYSFLHVPEIDTDHEVGVIYSQPASGSLNITGGTINIDTKITGLMTNVLLSPKHILPCDDNIYRIGAPGNGMLSYSTIAISGGVISIAAGGNGIECDGSVVINQNAIVNIELAYNGIQASDIVIGTDPEEVAAININVISTSLLTRSRTYSYLYDSSLELHNHYTIDATIINDSSNLYTYGGKVITAIDVDKVMSVILRLSEGTQSRKEYQYKALGRCIDVDGYIRAEAGYFELFGPNLSDMIPVKCTSRFIVDKLVTMLITGVDPNDDSMPKYGTCAFIQLERGASWEAGQEFKVDSREGNPIYRKELINAGSFLIFIDPTFEPRSLYDVKIDDHKYLLRAKDTLGGAS